VSPQALAYAREHHLIDVAADGSADALRGADVLIIAVPLAATLEILQACIAGGFGPVPELVVDVASVKMPLLPFVSRLHGFVPTHPLAGAESSGASASRADLFANRPWVYVPTGNAERDRRAVAFITAMGAQPFALDAERHDRIVALTSHLPQVLSTVLASMMTAQTDPAVARLHGPGLESMLRLARSGWSMWSPILSANAQPIAKSLRSFAESLAAVADRLDADETAPLEAVFEQANAFAAQLDADRSP
jgi:prephenate dehydrogenase